MRVTGDSETIVVHLCAVRSYDLRPSLPAVQSPDETQAHPYRPHAFTIYLARHCNKMYALDQE